MSVRRRPIHSFKRKDRIKGSLDRLSKGKRTSGAWLFCGQMLNSNKTMDIFLCPRLPDIRARTKKLMIKSMPFIIPSLNFSDAQSIKKANLLPSIGSVVNNVYVAAKKPMAFSIIRVISEHYLEVFSRVKKQFTRFCLQQYSMPPLEILFGSRTK